MEPSNGQSHLHPMVKSEPFSGDYHPIVANGVGSSSAPSSSSAQFSFVYAEQFAQYPGQQPPGAVAVQQQSFVDGPAAIVSIEDNASAVHGEYQNGSIDPHSASASSSTPVKQRHIYESPEARTRRLARNAERMRERRSNESEEDYRARLRKMAACNRERRERENEVERAMRHIRDAARQRLRRVMETPEQRATRLAKLAERSRVARANETPEQRSERQRKCLESNRLRYQRKQEQQQQLTNGVTAAMPVVKTATNPAQVKMEYICGTNQSDGPNAVTQTATTTIAQSPESLYHTYQVTKPPPFPELPPHLAPSTHQEPRYFMQTPSNFAMPGHSNGGDSGSHVQQPLQYVYSVQPTAIQTSNAPQTMAIGQSQHSGHGIQTPTTSPYAVVKQQPSPVSLDPTASPAVTIGRPLKIFPSNDYRSIAPQLHDEAQRQHQLNQMLDTQITHIISHPRSARGRPAKGPETEEERSARLRRMADQRAAQRDRETPEERAARLRDLAERARKRREQMLSTETPDERRDRLQRQAEYARQRQAGLTPQRRDKQTGNSTLGM